MVHRRTNRIVGVNLKMYFGVEETRRWLEAAAKMMHGTDSSLLEIFVLPSFLSLSLARDLLAGSNMQFGAQDVSSEREGPFTGEVSASMLREVGCTYVAIGHAERRRLFGEDDELTKRKAAVALESNLIPVVCVGETEKSSVGAAVEECISQITPVLETASDSADLLFAYEPVWAIGATQPAEAQRTLAVASRLRQTFESRPGRTRLLYGGSAGPGIFDELATGIDGLFLGRFAHDVNSLRKVLLEMNRDL
jgi:triosephosphate isomerase